jgi:hypothetical protein
VSQAVSLRPCFGPLPVRVGECGGQSGTGKGVSPNTSAFPPVSFHQSAIFIFLSTIDAVLLSD